METPEQIQKKIATYKQALADVVEELTAKRTALGELANLTVEELKPEIPLLKKQIKEQEKKLESTKADIAQRIADFEASNIDLKGHYENLERLLKDEYTKRKAELDKQEKDVQLLNNKLKEGMDEIVLKEKELQGLSVALDEKRTALDISVSEFQAEKTKGLLEIDNSKNKLQEKIDKLDIKNSKVDAVLKDLGSREESLILKVKQADEIIERISEANEILAVAKYKETQADERHILMNEQSAKNSADLKKNNIRTEELDLKEKKINEREANVRIAEAALKA